VTAQEKVKTEIGNGGAIRWTHEETLKLLLLRGDGLKRRELGIALGKSEWGIKKRLERVRRRVL
jgi:hypothetical protein